LLIGSTGSTTDTRFLYTAILLGSSNEFLYDSLVYRGVVEVLLQ
jgi:hypothetical protein